MVSRPRLLVNLLAGAALAAGVCAAPAITHAADAGSGDLHSRIAGVDAYLKSRPGLVGYVVRDRVTGAVFSNANANTEIWTASTIKLAMVTYLLTHEKARLSPQDYADIDAMLHVSDDNAADRLWFKYSGADHMAFNNAFGGFGMTGLQPKSGYTKFYPYWGFQKCSAADLDRLMQYVLMQVDPADRAYIAGRMRLVDPIQQWGVWGAGPAMSPGNKDGWSDEDTGAIANSVGFAGPGERYTLAIMDSLNGQGDIANGQATDTHVAQLLLAGLPS
ncbi:tat pathway signal sequence [Skermania sp. ID1734]|uniref:tat pathway signal sequence n=1 Tax=Skermania sp. ID1734 TaxID=2597516 RepID=UPI001180FC35|nr:tat pathway signal sequence [Skermania sp. ID1734]TSD93441.1 tat pathway signal sequence [Skermania sp. ID1734]